MLRRSHTARQKLALTEARSRTSSTSLQLEYNTARIATVVACGAAAPVVKAAVKALLGLPGLGLPAVDVAPRACMVTYMPQRRWGGAAGCTQHAAAPSPVEGTVVVTRATPATSPPPCCPPPPPFCLSARRRARHWRCPCSEGWLARKTAGRRGTPQAGAPAVDRSGYWGRAVLTARGTRRRRSGQARHPSHNAPARARPHVHAHAQAAQKRQPRGRAPAARGTRRTARAPGGR